MSEAIAHEGFIPHYDFAPSAAQRAGLTLLGAALGAAGGCALAGDPARQALWLAAVGIALAWSCCDVRARLLPLELSAAFAPVAICWQALGGLESLAWSLAMGAMMALIFLALGKLYSLIGADHAVGGGDMRLAAPVGVACGAAGMLPGLAGAAAALALHLARIRISSGGLSRSTGIPMGPMLAAWALCGMLGPALVGVAGMPT
jgi:leader peptidase (prepilin peptidase) / N-methyltransferase